MKKTIAQVVTENKDRALECGTTKELYLLGKELGFDNRSAFPRYKAALLNIGIDYDAVKRAAAEQREATLEASVTEEVTLYSDAKARCERFAICDRSGAVVWYGRFFDGEGSEQSAAELEAALKAIWLASKIRNEVCEQNKTIKLNLIVDAQWLVTLSGNAAALSEAARRFNIKLNVEWISGRANPADKWTTESGFKKWSDNNLASLVGSQSGAKESGSDESDTPEVQEVSQPIQEAATEQNPEHMSRVSEDRNEWFTMMGSEWPKLRDEMKTQGLSSGEREKKVNAMIGEWIQAGRPALQHTT